MSVIHRNSVGSSVIHKVKLDWAVDPGVKGKHLIKKVSDYVAMWSTWLSGKVVLC